MITAALLRNARLILAALVAPLLLTLLAQRFFADGQPDVHGPTIRIETVNLYYGHVDAGAVVALADRHDVDVLSATARPGGAATIRRGR